MGVISKSKMYEVSGTKSDRGEMIRYHCEVIVLYVDGILSLEYTKLYNIT